MGNRPFAPNAAKTAAAGPRVGGRNVLSAEEKDPAIELQLRNQMLDASIACIEAIGLDGTLIHMNRSGCIALGVPVNETRFGMKWLDRLPAEARKRGKHAFVKACNGQTVRFASMNTPPGKKPQYWDNILSPMKNAADETVAVLCVSRDVTKQRDAQARLRYASEVDALTGAWNRRTFRLRLQRSLTNARNKGTSVAIYLLDLDYFKHVNDTLGHPAGDHLLRVLSRRLRDCIPKGSYVSRLGGDEFAVVVPDADDEDAVASLAETLLHQIEVPITFTGKVINSGMSIGIALFPRDANDISGMLRCADTALNRLKAGHRGGVQMFNADMMAEAAREAGQLGLARTIIRNDAILPHYQPIISLADNSIIGMETLLRWTDADGSIRAPDQISKAFADFDLATRIAESMHRMVLEDISSWISAGRRVNSVTINASSIEFLRDDFAERLLSLLQEFRLQPGVVDIEITECMLLARGSDYVRRALSVLRSAGTRIILDNFGTGQSSITSLRDYPIDVLKIDRTLIDQMLKSSTTLAMVEAICMLGPRLSKSVVAEGVETAAQAGALAEMGCEFAQGFFFGAAVPAELMALLLPRRTVPSCEDRTVIDLKRRTAAA